MKFCYYGCGREGKFLVKFKSGDKFCCEKRWRKCPNLNKRSIEFPLDHKFSIYQGFLNKIDPELIGHWKNLEIVDNSYNSKKTR